MPPNLLILLHQGQDLWEGGYPGTVRTSCPSVPPWEAAEQLAWGGQRMNEMQDEVQLKLKKKL